MAVSALFLLNGFLYASWVGRIPAVQERLGLTHARLGVALLCLAAGAVVALPTGGWLCGKYGSHRVTACGASLFCLLLPSLGWVSSPAGLMVALLLLGALHGAWDVAMNAQAVAVEERYAPRPIMSSLHALWSTGGLLGAAIAGGVAAAGVKPLPHFAAAGWGLGGVVCAVALPRFLQVSLPMHAGEEEQRPGRRTLFPPALLALGGIAFCVMMGEGAMADWTALYLREHAHAAEALAAAGYGAFSVAMALGRCAGDTLTLRLGSERLLRGGGLLGAAGLGLALAWPQVWGALFGFTLVGAGFSTVVPVTFSSAGRVPGISPGRALGTVTTLGYTGFLLGPPLIGFAAELWNLRLALGLVVLVSLLLAGLTWALPEPAPHPAPRDPARPG